METTKEVELREVDVQDVEVQEAASAKKKANWDQFLTSIVFGILATAAEWMMRKAANQHAARNPNV